MVPVELFEMFVRELWSMTRSKGSIADDWKMFSIDIRLLHRLACVNKGVHAIVSSVTFRKVCLPLCCPALLLLPVVLCCRFSECQVLPVLCLAGLPSPRSLDFEIEEGKFK